MEKLSALRRYNASVIFGAFFGILVLTLLVTTTLLMLISTTWIGYVGGAVIVLIGGVVASIVLGRTTTKATEFLARAILHVSQQTSTVSAPDVASVPASRDFIESLARNIYEMASTGMPTIGNANQPQSNLGSFQKTLLQNTPLAVYVLNKNGELTYANQTGIEYAKLKIPEAYGQKFYDVIKLAFVGEETLESWLNQTAKTKATDSHSWDRVKLSFDDSSQKLCDLAVHFSKDNPEGVEAVIVLFDHTERYSKDDHGASFVSMAVHELRTPLTIMRGYIEVFEDEVAPKLEPEQAEFMRNLSAQAQQLAAFVNNIQNFARIEGSELSVSLKEEDWGSIVDGAVRDMNLRANVRRKLLQLQIEPNLPHVAVDRSTIYEVLVNLIENAVKYTHSDAPVVIRTYKKDDNWIETVIEDKGIGIPEAVMAHLFDKFYRSHLSNKTVGGTGLGLYLSKSIVTAHGGEIWAKSHEGEGSTFGFTVPTFASVASQIGSDDNNAIVRGAHGWIKNHSLYRG